MNKETILQEKADKYFVYFDDNQKTVILEAMQSYAKSFQTENKTDKAMFIIKEIGSYFGLPEDYNKLKSRKGELIKARQIAMYFIKKHTILSLHEIGRLFNKDHSTVISAIRNVNNYIDTDKNYKSEMLIIRTIIDEKLENLTI
jgi:chromosomal replication initiator protein